ncbi:helix-turn-helix domain-containing protein [Wenyingzhuangia sp. IMCC45574]
MTKLSLFRNMDGFELAKKRKELDMTQEELGQEVGMSKNTIYNYETSGKIPKSKIPLFISLFNMHYKPEKENTNRDLTSSVKKEEKPRSLDEILDEYSVDDIMSYISLNLDKRSFENNKIFKMFETIIIQRAIIKGKIKSKDVF